MFKNLALSSYFIFVFSYIYVLYREYLDFGVGGVTVDLMSICIVVGGGICFVPGTLPPRYKLALATIVFAILPVLAFREHMNNLWIYWDFAPLWVYLVESLFILSKLGLLISYAYFKSFFGDVRPIWYYASIQYIKNSLLGRENLLVTLLWLSVYLVFFGYVVFKVLRYFLYEYDIGNYYSTLLLFFWLVFGCIWLWSMFKSTTNRHN